ncbi:MAG: hypothetical protein WBW61_07120, partial [Rhodanobacteraceae bacterium]
YWSAVLFFALLAGAAPSCAADGDLDLAFADGGRLVIAPADASLGVTASTVQRDGKLLFAGYRWYVGSQPFDNQIAVWRVRNDGTLDSSFGDNGMATLSFGDTFAEPWSIVAQDDGHILIAASADGFGIFRLDADGSPDAEFGTDGRVILDFSDLGYAAGSFAWAVGHDAAGNIVASGSASSSQSPDVYSMAFSRLHADGSPDVSFGNGGRLVVPFGTMADPRNSTAAALIVDTDGSLTAAGTVDVTTNGVLGFGAVRLRSDGTLDPAFGSGGLATFDPPGGNGGRAFSLFAHDHGLLVAGSCGYNSAETTLCAVRLGEDGSIDSTWGIDGWGQIPVGGGMRSLADAVLQDDGKLVLAGTAPVPLPTDFAIGRLTADGHPDATFGSAGFATVSFDNASGEDRASTLTLQAGRIVVAGSTTGVPSLRALAATRLQNALVFADGFE